MYFVTFIIVVELQRYQNYALKVQHSLFLGRHFREDNQT